MVALAVGPVMCADCVAAVVVEIYGEVVGRRGEIAVEVAGRCGRSRVVVPVNNGLSQTNISRLESDDAATMPVKRDLGRWYVAYAVSVEAGEVVVV